MKNVLIIGGGIAGCTVARELSKASVKSTLLEKDTQLGGKVRTYGCKASNSCNDCGVCLSGNLWTQVEEDPDVSKYFGASLIDIYRDGSSFVATVEREEGDLVEIYASEVVVASGFEDVPVVPRGNTELKISPYIHTGSELEELLRNRSSSGLFETVPKSIGFIMCYGSRDVKEKSDYCSRVCCSYATKSAKVMRHYYPDAEITLFYMDIQTVDAFGYSDELRELGIRLERCKPAKIEFDGEYPAVTYDGVHGLTQKKFDELFLCNGVYASDESTSLSNITGLKVDPYGFLEYVSQPESSRIYMAGCVSGPKSISESVEDAKTTAASIIKTYSRTVL